MNRSEGWTLFALCALFAAAYAVFGLFRHWHFGSSAYDLGIFDQAVWHLSRFEAPASTISGFSNILGDHFYPIIFLLAPLYWGAPHPETLIVAQAVLLAASIVPVYLYLRDRLATREAQALSVAYGLFWGIQRTAAFDVHEMAFAPLFIATAILTMDRRQWRPFWAACAAMILVKEDLIPLLTGFGAYLMLTGERARGSGLLIGSLAIFACVTGVVVPAFSDSGGYAYTSLYRDFLWQPWRVPLALVTPAIKVETAFLWLVPFLFLSLASPVSMLIVPLAVERFLSPFPQHWGTAFHYSAPLAPILAMSAGDGLSRLMRHRAIGSQRVIAAMMGAIVILSAVLPGNQPLWRLFTPRHYARTSNQQAGYDAIEMIPAQASVVAQAAVVPHLSERHRIFLLDARAPEADYVIAAAGLSPWPANNFDEIQILLEDWQRRGYATIFDREGWIVLTASPQLRSKFDSVRH